MNVIFRTWCKISGDIVSVCVCVAVWLWPGLTIRGNLDIWTNWNEVRWLWRFCLVLSRRLLWVIEWNAKCSIFNWLKMWMVRGRIDCLGNGLVELMSSIWWRTFAGYWWVATVNYKYFRIDTTYLSWNMPFRYSKSFSINFGSFWENFFWFRPCFMNSFSSLNGIFIEIR